ncbi:AAA family ATPase [Rhizobium sp. 21-4511-3d]
MIRIEKIEIRKFRGIIDLTIEPGGSNFAACGPNGTGKSGIVDAIEFALTGGISRLSGRGTGGLSVKLHGPHVDFRNTPEEASVTLHVTLPSLGGKKARITRTAGSPAYPKIEPSTQDVRNAFHHVAQHPEFALSRRELIRYVLAEPKDRATEVQALLRLEHVEKLRATLFKISNRLSREVSPLKLVDDDARQHFLDAVQLASFSTDGVLSAINSQRTLLGVQALTKLTATTDFLEGLEDTSVAPAAPKINKELALSDLKALRENLEILSGEAVKALIAQIVVQVDEITADPLASRDLRRQDLLKSALEDYDGSRCPVCDTSFLPGQLEEHVKSELQHFDQIGSKKAAIGKLIEKLLEAIRAAGSSLTTTISYGALVEPAIDLTLLIDFRVTLGGRYKQLEKQHPLDDTAAVLKADYGHASLKPKISELEAAIGRIPEANAQDQAKTFLTIARERFRNLQKARREHHKATIKAKRATDLHKIYAETTTQALSDIYAKVQDTFADYYADINKDDEGTFSAHLTPSNGKLGLDVDFYGRGHFPPGAYHSEGHQDGMGLCLYLALMNHLLGDSFTFAVLDDVLMSVDRGHRREVCRLLKLKFPKTQFIFTTHDEVWLRHLKSSGLLSGKNSSAHFKTWTVDAGPTSWDTKSVWEEIEAANAAGDVSTASATLRRYLEYFAGEASHRLRGKVEYRGDGDFVFGDLMSGATAALGDGFKKAKVAAKSWSQAEVLEKIEVYEANFVAARTAANADQWQINKTIHYNPWADLTSQEFAPVVAAYKVYTQQFSCHDCGTMLSVTPVVGSKEAIRCDCGTVNLNFVAKSSGIH